MTNKELLRKVKDEACSCDMMVGYSCYFCKELKPKLEKAVSTRYSPTKSPYEPRKMRGVS